MDSLSHTAVLCFHPVPTTGIPPATLGDGTAEVTSGLLGSLGQSSMARLSAHNRKSSLLSEGRSVFKPVVHRVKTLELQVKTLSNALVFFL